MHFPLFMSYLRQMAGFQGKSGLVLGIKIEFAAAVRIICNDTQNRRTLDMLW